MMACRYGQFVFLASCIYHSGILFFLSVPEASTFFAFSFPVLHFTLR